MQTFTIVFPLLSRVFELTVIIFMFAAKLRD